MGVLVYGTLHTNSAAKTIDRIIDVFPAEQQEQTRTVLSESLKAIVAQQLLRKKTGGRVAVNEILIASPAVANIIRENKIESLINIIQSGKNQGMISMDDALESLLKSNVIEAEDAFMKSIDKRRFDKYLHPVAALH